jgi:glycosyltransferase involved in cell wall biosynthesis
MSLSLAPPPGPSASSPSAGTVSAQHRLPGDGRVAAIVPVYRGAYLADALRSVFAQTRRPDEVLVIDDGSPDQDALSAAIAPYGSQIRLIRQPNLGAAAARNRGIEATTAEFVALLDADDEWFPDFLATQLATLQAQPDLDLVYSDGLVTGQTGLSGQRFMQSCPSRGDVTLEGLLAQRCTVLLSAVVARRHAIVRADGFDVALRRGQDFDLWLRMARLGARIAFTERALVLRRVHDSNLSGTQANEQERPLRVLEKALRTMALSPRERRVATRRITYLRGTLAREQAKELLMEGDFVGARRALRAARRGSWSWKVDLVLLGLRVAPTVVQRLYLRRRAGTEMVAQR